MSDSMSTVVRRLRYFAKPGYGPLARGVWRASRWWSVAVVSCVVGGALAPNAVIVASGKLIGALPALAGAGLSSPAGGTALSALMAFLTAALASTVVGALAQAAQSQLARAYQRSTLTRVAIASMAPVGISHLEDPAPAEEFAAASEAHREGVYEQAVHSACSLVSTRLTGVFAGALLLSYRWWAPIVLGAALLVLVRTFRTWFEVVYDMLTDVSGAERRRAAYLRALLITRPAAKEVRVFAWVPWMDERIREVWIAAMSAVWKFRRRRAIRPLVVATAALLVGNTLVLGSLGRSMLTGQVSAAEAVVYLQLVLTMALLGEFGSAGYDLSRSAAAARQLDRLDTSLAGPEAVGDRAPGPASGPTSINLRDVAFQYPGSSAPVLRGLSVEIAAGQSVAIVGANGAGKSTLVKLICGLYEPTSGSLTVDHGAPAAHRVAAVFQQFGRYELPLRDNVAFGNPDIPPDEHALGAALNSAGGLPGRTDVGWGTILSSSYADGTDLSGGQWQRIALARALYAVRTKATGLLVLDEPTAALDVRAEIALFEQLLTVAAGTTSVLVTHRLSAVRRVDRILVLDRGVLTEDGNHAELIRQQGTYAAMFAVQAQRFRAATGEKRP